jgi:peptidoglycan/xylan/chitin deacetylase (PgdA/CDA1 family)
MFLHKSNFLMRAVYPDFQWKVKTNEKVIYLTFDDGPIPDITDAVLDCLAAYNAKATFFCIGDNIQKHPEVFDRVIAQGHTIGNHTFNHLRGWATKEEIYLTNFQQCEEVIREKVELTAGERLLFRPPHGRIKKGQAKAILQTHEIVMWDVLTGDFSADLSPERVLQKTLKYTESGSIVVFHDSLKAEKKMLYALPRMLQHFSELGYVFSPLTPKGGIETAP